jgi:UDP-N-acetylmuramate dehydrogenase
MMSLERIRSLCSGRIAIDEALAESTTFRLGGPADITIEPATSEELRALLAYFRSIDCPCIILGNGSNVLVSDDGFRGAAIRLDPGFASVAVEHNVVTAGAGLRLAAFVDACIRNGLAGAEMLAGIPGTLGGAIIMNAGAWGGQISDHLLDVTVLRDGAVAVLPKEACGFGYRRSALRCDVVLGARFRFPAGDPDAMAARRKELLQQRNLAQPTRLPNAGSIFRNPPGEYAARLIDRCGLKGLRSGGAEVSPQHANFIVNTGSATSGDVLDLIRQIRSAVHEQTGIALELEIVLIGFPPDAARPVE